ncbi:MAG: hypothetical protein Q8L51_00805 [Candidatus Amesbacteria bacterium]|nr:hypothetical protein [Candidatus Amesbacteria bacterium]
MFGFLIKLVLVTAVIGGVVGYLSIKNKQSPKEVVLSAQSQIESLAKPEKYQDIIKNIDTKVLLSKVGQTLDNLVTNQTKDSPVVLGLKVTNESLGAITDVLQKLPNDQLQQIRSVVCASPSAN